MAKKILLCVDDEATGLKIRKLILERHGYEVYTAEEGEEGLRIFEREAVDAVVLDYYMPGMNGGTVAAQMKRLKPAVPIILLSAFFSLPDGSMNSIDAFLTKGDSPEILLQKLDEIVRSH